ncbi:MAG: substrate-binding domain-containing protein [Verrucomicrobiae bacterium]|nr:substrate-binding domain-containing protein [Verrucomicrobiae bacterium]NNJ86645.1 substrate-binding domain-containing protein [Akkermansiaceae bacterium]
MGRFCQLHPRVKINIADSSSEQMLGGIHHGEFDLIIGVRVDDPLICWHSLREENFNVAVPRDHGLADKKMITPEDLDGRRLLLLSRADYPGYWQEVMTYFRDHEINAKVAGEFDGIGSLRLGLEANLGIALVAQGAQMGSKIALKPMVPEPAPISVAVGYAASRPLDPWTEAFVSELEMASGGDPEHRQKK